MAAAPGGVSCYGTTVYVDGKTNVLRITVSTAGDTHLGAALRLGCRIRPASTGLWSFCNAVGTGAAPGSYITKNKLPTSAGNTNCNDGGGGSADCHDNSIEQTWCVPVNVADNDDDSDSDGKAGDVFDIDIRIGPGAENQALVFIEASTFFVDSTRMAGQCGDGDASLTTNFNDPV